MKLSNLKPNLTIQLLLVVLFVTLFGDHLSERSASVLYAISLSIKDCLVFVLPIIIFSCLFSCMLSFKDKAIPFVLMLVFFVCTSNFISTWVSYSVSSLALRDLLISSNIGDQSESLDALWQLGLPMWVSNDQAIVFSFIMGALLGVKQYPWVTRFEVNLKWAVTTVLHKILVPILPIFALGFVVKMRFDGTLSVIANGFIPVLIAILSTYLVYLSLLYFIGANGQIKRWLMYLKNVFPAGIMGFSSMSSLAALPISMQAAEDNTGNPQLARALLPATTNIHLIGDSIAIPMLAIAILMTYNVGFPDPMQYLIFTLYFVIAKFAVAAVPGGGIFVMVPILERHLGFDGQMSALIISLYILLDPIITATNVLGNGALAVLVSKLYPKQTE